MLFAFLPMMLFADNVTEEKAQAIAQKFFTSSRKMMNASSKAPQLRMVWNGESNTTRSAEAPAFYVYNNENGKGFVIVSGDERTATPILGYSFDQNFSADDMPENLSTWMNGIRSEINDARVKNITSVNDGQWEMFDWEKEPIKLLETALWDQRSPYNSELPLGYVTGCPATAISIIMRYHKWPEKGVGTIPESNEAIGDVELGHTYDWDNMPLTYCDMPTDYQKKQVGVLMRDVGAMVRTQYGQGSAGAKPEETLPQLLPIYMRYNAKTIKSLFKKNFSDEEWHALMQKELDEERPILYGGYSSGGGHQFVLDGYAADNFYHVNWGWSGISNGYYLLTVMNPPQQGAGGSVSKDGFTMRQDAIIGIQPDPENPGGGYFDLLAFKPWYKENPYGISCEEKEFKQGVEFKVVMKEIQNKGSRDFSGQFGVAHFAADGTIKEVISKKNVDLTYYPLAINESTEFSFKNECVINKEIEPGDYIAGVFKYQNPSEWTTIRNGYLDRDNCVEKIVIMEEGELPTPVTYDFAINMNEGGKVICDGQEYTASTTIKAEENKQFEISVTPNEGYEIESVFYNGNDLTYDLQNGSYTLPAITDNSVLDVKFVKPVYHNVAVTVGEGGKFTSFETIVEGGSTADLSVKDGENIFGEIETYEGYKLSSVLLNGVEQIDVMNDFVYQSEPIFADATLVISFSDVTGIDNVNGGDIKVSAENGMVTIAGLEASMPVSIFTTDGAMVKSAEATASAMQFALAQGQIYIVRVADRIFKVVL